MVIFRCSLVNKVLSSLFLSSLMSIVSAQERFATYQLSTEELVSRNVKVFFDDSGNLLADIDSYTGNSRVLFKAGQNAQVIYNEKDQGEKSSGILTKAEKEVRGYKRLATLFQNESYFDCYYSSKKDAVFFTSLDSNGRSGLTDTVKLKPTETIAVAVEDNGAIYVLSYIDHSSVLKIYVKRPGKEVASVEKTISANVSAPGDRKEKTNFSEFFEGKNERATIVYDNSHPNPPCLSVMQRKIYHQDGKLILSLENYLSETRLVVINLHDFTLRYLEVQPSFLHIPDKYKGLPANSSVVSGNYLFKSGKYNDTFYISATNLNTGAMACNFVVNTSNSSLLIKTTFFDSASYKGLTGYRKKRMNAYLKSSGIGAFYAGNNLYGIEIFGQSEWETSSLFSGMMSMGRFPFINFSNALSYTLRNQSPEQEGTLIIRNIFDASSGNFVPQNNAISVFEEWDSIFEQVKDLLNRYSYSEDRPQTIASGGKIYAYLIEPSTGQLVIYKL